MTTTPKFRIDSPRSHPAHSPKCSRCEQPTTHVLVVSFSSPKPQHCTTYKTSLCSGCLQRMLVEDTPIAAAAIAQLLEERNNK
jgi:hypothetical protein